MPKLHFIHDQYFFYFLFFKVVQATGQFRGDISFCNEHVRPEQTIVWRLLVWNPTFSTQIWCRCLDSYSESHLFERTAKSHLQNSQTFGCYSAQQM